MAGRVVRLRWWLPRVGRLVLLAVVASLGLVYYQWATVLPHRDDADDDWNRPVETAAATDAGRTQKTVPTGDMVDWADYHIEEEDRRRTGPGEQGAAYALPKDADVASRKDKVFRMNGFNGLASEYISLNRSVKDIRHPQCRGKKYPKNLPRASVIIPFHNEHNQTLLRTVHSIIRQSPQSLLEEVVLSDDASTAEWLKEPLERYIKEHFKPGLVKLVRAPEREGLIRARLRGAKAASGQVLIFLDAHSECNYNWLPPLLTPIAMDQKTAVCPFVDVIDWETFEYRAQDEGARGAFDWLLYYKRLPLKPQHQSSPTEPFDDPVMAGGYFAVDARWFWTLGGYDEGLEIWGGEQYELSFKIWQCGGRLVDAPCSRVGHIYRRYSPIGGGGSRPDYLSRNYKRVAVVWMDEYAEHIYSRRPHYRNLDPGDVTKQLEVRKRLQCKPFDWFIKHVVPDIMEHYPPVEPEPRFRGPVRSAVDDRLCVDAQFSGNEQPLQLHNCTGDNGAGAGQQFEMTFREDVRPRRRPVCWDVPQAYDGAPVILYACHGQRGNQHWRLVPESDGENYQLQHVPSKKCLEAKVDPPDVQVFSCDRSSKQQFWAIENVKPPNTPTPTTALP